jgi:hypothetical protein
MENMNAFLAITLSLPLVLGLALLFMYRQRAKLRRGGVVSMVAWNVVLLLWLLSLVLATGEGYYRAVMDKTDGANLSPLSQRWFARHFTLNNVLVRDNIDYALRVEGGGTRRVTFIGDSFTAGHGIKDVSDRFANIIRSADPSMEVHTFASNGLETVGQVQLLDRTPNEYEFDVVVLVYVLNDIGYLIEEMQTVNAQVRSYLDGLHPLQRESWFIGDLSARYYISRLPAFKESFEHLKSSYFSEDWDMQKEMLLTLKSRVEERGGKLLVVTFPLMDLLQEDYEFRQVHDRLSTFWMENGVPHLDLLKIYGTHEAGELVVNSLDAHPNEMAHRMAAEAILPFIKSNW